VSQNDFIKKAGVPRFDGQGGFGDKNFKLSLGLQPGDFLFFLLEYEGVEEPVEKKAFFVIGKNDGAEFGPVYGLIGLEYRRSKMSNDLLPGRLVRPHEKVSRLIGMMDVTAEIFEDPGRDGFSGGYTARQRYDKHGAGLICDPDTQSGFGKNGKCRIN
jgi:hypothetical protein